MKVRRVLHPLYICSVLLLMGVAMVLAFPFKPTLAQEESEDQTQTNSPRGIAEYVPVENADLVQHGHIIIFTNNGYQLSSTPYNEDMVGVISKSPSVAVSFVGTSGTLPLVTSGTAEVLVQGPVSVGDYVTSSSTIGVGQRAVDPGYVLGRALASTDSTETVLLPIGVEVGFVWPPGAGVAFGSLVANPGETLAALPRPLRYVAAGVVVLLSLIAGYWIFSKTAASTVAALGRNPLAKRSIYLLASFQTGITLVLVIAGIIFGYLILTL